MLFFICDGVVHKLKKLYVFICDLFSGWFFYLEQSTSPSQM
uniref:Uncharacterized protein n=1 Tax=viral metagenome TaxID=1070528 RepID=A0A6C0AFN8_9ZZZZ